MAAVQAGLFKTSLGRKYFMGLTGLFLCLFLVVHMAGNLQLFNNDNGEAFNKYSWFMTHNIFIRIISLVNFGMFFLHVVDGIMITRHNKNARPVAYHKYDQSKSSSLPSRNMGLFGAIILVFLVTHLKTFWFEMHFGNVPLASYPGDTTEYKDLYKIVEAAFSQPWYVALYVISMLALGFHLYHGFQAAFRSLGIVHHRYTPWIKSIGVFAFAILIPALFAAMPLYFLLR